MTGLKTINKDLLYIGVDDEELDLFESQYSVPDGITYNSYMIIDDKIAIIDTVDRRKSFEWWKQVAESLNGRTPDYLIVQHMEPDHSGNIDEAMTRWPQMQIVASTRAVQMLPQFLGNTVFTNRIVTVKEGDTLSLGHHTLQFFMAPMVHWPEVMVTYDQTDKTIFSADAFGTFGVLRGEIFADNIPEDSLAWPDEARRYYFNICGKYGSPVQTLLKKLSTLDIDIICPLHGPILSNDISHYIKLYDRWSRYEADSNGILIAHASIHGGTAKAAHQMAELLRSLGATEVKLIDLCRCDLSSAVAEAFHRKTTILAASSYDASVFTPMYDFLHRLSIKGYQQRRVALIENGSWAPTAGRVMKELLATMKAIDIIEPMVSIRSTLKATDLPALEELAKAVMTEES